MNRTAADLSVLSQQGRQNHNAQVYSVNTDSSEAATQGGWKGRLQDSMLPRGLRVGQCDIAQVNASISSKELIDEFILKGRPVLVKGAASSWKDRSRWTKQNVSKNWGHVRSRHGAFPYSWAYGFKEDMVQVKDFIGGFSKPSGEVPQYIFSEDYDGSFKGLHPNPGIVERMLGRHDQLPLQYQPLMEPSKLATPHSAQFGLGPALSGAPPHFHEAAFNALLYGRKHWLLWVPENAPYGAMPALTFVKELLPNIAEDRRPLECTQESGDVFYLPSQWGHCILNLAESICFAQEFTTKYFSSI
eukprot:gnl/TRDRNA2_/TRDRNA2_122938_c3_seq1.p1 gnl/TRDRNA2_/TRDRNA2_122938_c3~~gnl/TRDRNA2_/TRDRNA2_122938_c3_seq1.p1  ORF type:complete len:302 (-),score=37.16 gnl/TRDRNA2_/TRDRNA2_122938_c3_seq1:47-952(-)